MSVSWKYNRELLHHRSVMTFYNKLIYLDNNSSSCLLPGVKLITSSHPTQSRLNSDSWWMQYFISFSCNAHAQIFLDPQTSSFSSHVLIKFPCKLPWREQKTELHLKFAWRSWHPVHQQIRLPIFSFRFTKFQVQMKNAFFCNLKNGFILMDGSLKIWLIALDTSAYGLHLYCSPLQWDKCFTSKVWADFPLDNHSWSS